MAGGALLGVPSSAWSGRPRRARGTRQLRGYGGAGDGTRWWGPGGERGTGVELGALAPSSARVQRVGEKGGGGRRKKGKEGEKEKRKGKKEKGKGKGKRKMEREKETELSAGFAAAVGHARAAAFGRSATSTQNERKGKGIGTGVGTADHRKNILGNRELGQERIWNDLSSATKKILENNIFSG